MSNIINTGPNLTDDKNHKKQEFSDQTFKGTNLSDFFLTNDKVTKVLLFKGCSVVCSASLDSCRAFIFGSSPKFMEFLKLIYYFTNSMNYF